MVYSALTSGSGLASGAASLASGALTSIRRNDLVTAASELLGAAESSHVTGVKWVFDYYDDWDADYRCGYNWHSSLSSVMCRYNGLGVPAARFPDLDYREAPGGRLHYQTQFGLRDEEELSSREAEAQESAIRPLMSGVR